MSFWQSLPSRIDPVLLHLGPFSLQWYSLMYVTALFTAYWLARRRLQREPGFFPPEAFEDAVPWIVLGVVIGARAAYVLFYDFQYFLSRPMAAHFCRGGIYAQEFAAETELLSVVEADFQLPRKLVQFDFGRSGRMGGQAAHEDVR